MLKPISSVQLRGIELIISSGVRQALCTKTVSIEFTGASNFFVKLRACKYRVTDIGTWYRNLRRCREWNFCHVFSPYKRRTKPSEVNLMVCAKVDYG